MMKRAVLLLCVCFLAGCGPEVDSQGKPHQKVSYSVAEKVEKSTDPRMDFTVPDYVAGESPVTVTPVGTPRSVRTDEWTVFRGRFKLPEASTGFGMIMLSYIVKGSEGEVTAQVGVPESGTVKKGDDGFWTYDVYVPAVRTPGKMTLKIELHTFVKPAGGGEAELKRFVVSETPIEIVAGESAPK